MNHQVGLGVGMAPVGAGVEDWVSGIEHICVGDSLVACSTEFSGSVLVFSLATGSLVYEIPGLYQPSKMCMTDFFLLTGGRGPWTQGERPMREQSHHYVYQNQTGQGHGYGHEFGHGHGQDDDHLRHAPPHLQGRHRGAEVDEYMSCCINVWDLRTGNRLYSLIPRLPTPVNALSLQRQRSPGSKIVGSPESLISRQSSPFLAPGTLGKKLEGLDLTENTQTDHDSNWIETPHSPEAPASAPLAAINSPLWQHSSSSFSYPLADSYGRSSQALSSASSVFSPIVPQSSAAVPLTLLDIAVTPDHSTLVATLCERSGEGREGVYCWDFSGSRLEGYHETNSALTGHGRGTVPTGEGWLSSANSAFASIVLDENGLKALGENDISDSDFGDDEVASNQPPNHSDPSDLDQNNNIIMQQVDSTALRDLHRARVTGKIWIGWQLDSREFAAQRDTRFMSILDRSAAHATAGDSKVSSTTTSLQDLSKAPDMRVGTGQEVSSSARLKGKAKAMQS
ncbi:hypothetical protein BGZ83_003306 [Gryganskiella cystojenkinii]|nr:hypothetical protein BGZ83_003306 [Gryganskiella cystojenkinii]